MRNSHSFIQKPIINISAFFNFHQWTRYSFQFEFTIVICLSLRRHLSRSISLLYPSLVVDSKFYDLLNAFKTSDDDIYHWAKILKREGGNGEWEWQDKVSVISSLGCEDDGGVSGWKNAMGLKRLRRGFRLMIKSGILISGI